MTAPTRLERTDPEDRPFDQDAPDPRVRGDADPTPARTHRIDRIRPYAGRHRAPQGTPRDRGPRRPPGAPLPRGFGFWDHRRFVHVGGGEQIAMAVQPSLQSWLPKVPVWLGLAALLGAVAAVAGGSDPLRWVTVLGFVVLFWWVGVRLARWRLAWYVVTNKRVMRVEGVWRRQAFTVPLDRITDVTYEQTWIEDKLGVGTVRVLSANEDSLVREMRSVPRPDEFFRTLWDLVNRSKMLLGSAGGPAGQPVPVPLPVAAPDPRHTGSGWDADAVAHGPPIAGPRLPTDQARSRADATVPQVPVTRCTLEF